ncbi:hypothetical protein [Nostoc sp.]
MTRTNSYSKNFDRGSEKLQGKAAMSIDWWFAKSNCTLVTVRCPSKPGDRVALSGVSKSLVMLTNSL